MLFRAIKSISHNKNAKNPILTLSVEGYGDVQIELEPDYAPNTVATIIKLAQNGFYDGKVFYGTDSKVVAGGMQLTTETVDSDQYDEEGNYIGPEGEEHVTKITAKEDALRVSDFDKNVTPYVSKDDENYEATPEDKRGNEETDYKVSIFGEFVANGFNDNTLRFEKGTIGLYRNNYSGGSGENLTEESYNSGTSLFFITTTEESSLNGEYTPFGKVIKGLDIIEKMLELPLETDGEANSTVGNLTEEKEITKYAEGSYPIITKATVETYGTDYGMPKYERAFDYNQYISDLITRYYSSNQ